MRTDDVANDVRKGIVIVLRLHEALRRRPRKVESSCGRHRKYAMRVEWSGTS
jgi:hypothetical protein